MKWIQSFLSTLALTFNWWIDTTKTKISYVHYFFGLNGFTTFSNFFLFFSFDFKDRRKKMCLTRYVIFFYSKAVCNSHW